MAKRRYALINKQIQGSSIAAQLSDLSDVNTSTPTNRNVLVADGTDWESRALVEADISDLGAYLENIVEDTTPQLGGTLDANGNTITDTTGALVLSGTNTVQSNSDFYLRGGSDLRVYDSTNTDFLQVEHDGTDINISHSGTTAWNVTGANSYLFDGLLKGQAAGGGTAFRAVSDDNWTSGTLNLPFIRWEENDGTLHAGIRAFTTDGANSFLSLGTGFFDEHLRLGSAGTHSLFSASFFDFRDGVTVRIYDSTDVDNAAFSHDGTDFNLVLTGSTHWNWTSAEVVSDESFSAGNVTTNPSTGQYVRIGTSGGEGFLDSRDFGAATWEVLNVRADRIDMEAASGVRVYNTAGGTDYAQLSHDGTNFTYDYVNTGTAFNYGANHYDFSPDDQSHAASIGNATLDHALALSTTVATDILGLQLYSQDATINNRVALFRDGTAGEWGLAQTWSSGGQYDFVLYSGGTAYLTLDFGTALYSDENIYVRGAHNFRVYDSTNVDYMQFAESGTNTQWTTNNNDIQILAGGGTAELITGTKLRIYDSTDTDHMQFSESGTNSQWTTNNNNIQILAGGGIAELITGTNLRIRDATNSDWLTFTHDGTNFTFAATNTTWLELTGTSSSGGFRVRDGGSIVAYDSTDSDWVRMRHDGTNGYIEHANTTSMFYGSNSGRPNLYHYFDTAGTDARIYLRQAGTDAAWFRQGGGYTEIRGLVHGEPVRLIAEDAAGSARNLVIGDPDGSVDLYYDAALTASTKSGGFLIQDSLWIDERSAAQADTAGQGQIWVRNDTPNTLMFTDDAGNDVVLSNTSIGEIQSKYLPTATTAKTNDTTLADESDLSGFDLETGATYILEAYISYIGGSVPNLKMRFEFSNSPAGEYSYISVDDTGVTNETDKAGVADTIVLDTINTRDHSVHIVGAVTANATTGGTMDFQWAQDTSDASGVSIGAHSWIRLTRVV